MTHIDYIDTCYIVYEGVSMEAAKFLLGVTNVLSMYYGEDDRSRMYDRQRITVPEGLYEVR